MRSRMLIRMNAVLTKVGNQICGKECLRRNAEQEEGRTTRGRTLRTARRQNRGKAGQEGGRKGHRIYEGQDLCRTR